MVTPFATWIELRTIIKHGQVEARSYRRPRKALDNKRAFSGQRHAETDAVGLDSLQVRFHTGRSGSGSPDIIDQNAACRSGRCVPSSPPRAGCNKTDASSALPGRA